MPDKLRQAAMYIPVMYRKAVSDLEEGGQAEEIRLRAGQFLSIVKAQGCEENLRRLPRVSPQDLALTMENATNGSLHTVLDSLQSGFIPLESGHRLGFCGKAVTKSGVFSNVRDISSVCIRIAREKCGIARDILPRLIKDGVLQNALILSPPGLGKTTLLREIIRTLSCGEGTLPMRVSVIDERGELAGCVGGLPQMDLGPRTDIWSGLGKADAAVMMTRGVSPQVLAMDEITAEQDISAAKMCHGCGVALLATAHGGGREDLQKRPLYRSLTEIFSRLVTITISEGIRKYHVQEISDNME